MVANIFTHNTISDAIFTIFKDPASVSTLSVTAADPSYYYFRADQRAAAKQNPMDHVGYTGIDDISASGFYKVDVTGKESREFNAEINFMKDLGLVIQKDNTFYIYDLAEVFYGPTGYFQNPSAGAAQAVLKVLYNFVLPGRFWTAFYTRSGLPDNVQPAKELEAHMRDIYDMIWSIVR